MLWRVRMEFGGFPSGDTDIKDTRGTLVPLPDPLGNKTAR